eukprot:12400770-Karenia_brevis.AAC.1
MPGRVAGGSRRTLRRLPKTSFNFFPKCAHELPKCSSMMPPESYQEDPAHPRSFRRIPGGLQAGRENTRTQNTTAGQRGAGQNRDTTEPFRTQEFQLRQRE